MIILSIQELPYIMNMMINYGQGTELQTYLQNRQNSVALAQTLYKTTIFIQKKTTDNIEIEQKTDFFYLPRNLKGI